MGSLRLVNVSRVSTGEKQVLEIVSLLAQFENLHLQGIRFSLQVKAFSLQGCKVLLMLTMGFPDPIQASNQDPAVVQQTVD